VSGAALLLSILGKDYVGRCETCKEGMRTVTVSAGASVEDVP